MASNLPAIDIPILSGATALALYGASDASPLQVGVPLSTPEPIPAVATINITDPGTRKRTVAGATMGAFGTGRVSLPTVDRVVTSAGTVPVATNAGAPTALSTILSVNTFLSYTSSAGLVVLREIMSSPMYMALTWDAPSELELPP